MKWAINISMILIMSALTSVLYLFPDEFSDQNAFLKEFVSKDFVSFMSVFVSISVAASATLYLEMNKFEEAAGRFLFRKAKQSLRRSAFIMGSIFAISILIVFTKHLPSIKGAYASQFNYVAIMMCILSAWLMLDVIRALFILPPKINGESGVRETPP